MWFVLILGIIGLAIGLLLACRKVWYAPFCGVVAGVSLGVITAVLVSGIFIEENPAPYHVESQETIILMSDDAQTNGRWALFGGYLNERMVFNYYARNAPNAPVYLTWRRADNSYIYEDVTEGEPYVVTFCEDFATWEPWYVTIGNTHDCWSDFHVPPGSVQPGINLDAQAGG